MKTPFSSVTGDVTNRRTWREGARRFWFENNHYNLPQALGLIIPEGELQDKVDSHVRENRWMSPPGNLFIFAEKPESTVSILTSLLATMIGFNSRPLSVSNLVGMVCVFLASKWTQFIFWYGQWMIDTCQVEKEMSATWIKYAKFGLAMTPFCFKLLWAPIVDSVYSKKIGRRKSWTIPMQYLMGISLLYIAMNFDDWLGGENGAQKPQTRTLGLVFFFCLVFASIQSIAIGGWALTMLKKTCRYCDNIGLSIGQFLGFVLFLGLESKEICNKFRSVPQDHGFISFSNFMMVWAIVFIVATTLILIFKEEANLTAKLEDDHDRRLGLKESYTRLWQIIKIAPVRKLCFIFLTYQVGLGPFNNVCDLKLIAAGVPSDTFALLTVPSLPFVVLVPSVLSRFLVGHLAMRTFTIAYVWRLIFGISYTVFIFFTPLVKNEGNELPAWHEWLLLFIFNANILIDLTMFIAIGAFFSRISDPRFGGTYTTLFHSVSSIGYRWPTIFSTWLVDFLTIQSCNESNKCVVLLDGFFIEVIACSLIAVLWLCWVKKNIYELEDMDVSEWKVKKESIPNRVNVSILK